MISELALRHHCHIVPLKNCPCEAWGHLSHHDHNLEVLQRVHTALHLCLHLQFLPKRWHSAMTSLGQPFKLRSDRHQVTHSFSSRCKLDNSFLSHLFLYFILAAFLTLHLHHLHPTKLQMFKMPRIVQTSSNRKHVSCQHPSLPFSSSL